MKRFIRKIFLAVVSIVVLGTLWIFRPYSTYDPDKVTPDLASLREPFQVVEGAYFLDGGSVGVRIIDADGVELRLAIPHESLDSRDNPQRLFVGALHASRAGAREVAYSDDTRLRLAEILRKHDGVDRSRDLCVFALTRRAKAAVPILYRKSTGMYPPPN